MTALAVASFAERAPFRAAVAEARKAGRRIVGLWSPTEPDLPGDEGSGGIVPAMAAAGVLGAGALYLLAWWSSVHGYPIDSGGRPLNSWPAFLVAPVEFGALVAGLAGVAAFFLRARLTRLHDAAFDIDEVAAGQRDRFVIAVACDAGEDANALVALLAGAGAVHSRVIEA